MNPIAFNKHKLCHKGHMKENAQVPISGKITVGSSGKMMMFFVDCVMHITLRLSVAV